MASFFPIGAFAVRLRRSALSTNLAKMGRSKMRGSYSQEQRHTSVSMTSAISKQLLPVYDKPMVVLSIEAALCRGNTRNSDHRTTPDDLPSFRRLLERARSGAFAQPMPSNRVQRGSPKPILLAPHLSKATVRFWFLATIFFLWSWVDGTFA